MTSMFEVLQLLPVFQGVSRDQLTQILEKTQLHFSRHLDGQIIREAGAACDSLIFVLSGEVRLVTPTFGGRVTISQDFLAPHTMPFNNLFGAETHERSTLVSIDKTGIMTVDKRNFLRLLQEHTVILVNVLNILSTRAQKQNRALDFAGEQDEVLRLASWLLAYTDRPAHKITIDATITDWCKMLHLDQAAFWKGVDTLRAARCVEVVGGRLRLTDRYALRTFISQRSAT